ncbi:MAG TPA: hypothetical protein VF708_05270 [Pyrinomonadaceae bacterium]
MKKLRLCFVTLLLTLTLTFSVLAGEMPTVGIAAPSPTLCADGEMPTVGITDPATEMLLTVMESILSSL